MNKAIEHRTRVHPDRFARNRLPWQQTQWDYIQACQRADRLPHALLFTGSQGIGKRIFAEHLAEKLLCTQASLQEDACGYCTSCRLMRAQTHPDFYLIAPEVNTSIKIEEIRALISVLHQTSGQYKVVLIDKVEQLSIAASHALLKTLEEPSADTIFILITHKSEALLPTLRSRCHRLRFMPPQAQLAQHWLQQQNAKADPNLLQLLLRWNEYAVLSVHALLFDEKILRLSTQFLASVVALRTELVDPLTLAKQYSAIDPEQCIVWFMRIIMDLIKIKLAVSIEDITRSEHGPIMQDLADSLTLNFLFAYYDHLVSLRSCYRSAPLNALLLIENLFCRWCICLEADDVIS